jgi:hypothetical protein
LANDEAVFYYGFSTTNQPVLMNDNCGLYTACYGQVGNWSSTPPALTSNFGTPCSFSLPVGTSEIGHACENGHAAYYGYLYDPYSDPPGLYAFNVGSNPRLIYPGFLANGIYMNSLGDIVFDDGVQDLWEEAIDLTTTPAPTPEPSTLLLLATGILGLGITLRQRRIA